MIFCQVIEVEPFIKGPNKHKESAQERRKDALVSFGSSSALFGCIITSSQAVQCFPSFALFYLNKVFLFEERTEVLMHFRVSSELFCWKICLCIIPKGL